MPVQKRDIVRNLPKKGFEKDRSGDHIRFRHKFEGKYTGPNTKVSHSPKVKEIDGDLLTQMRKQLRLETTAQLINLVDCPMTGDNYVEFLQQRGLI